MEHIETKSSNNHKSVSYDPCAKTMFINFRNGDSLLRRTERSLSCIHVVGPLF